MPQRSERTVRRRCVALMSDKYSKERANAQQGRLFLKNSEKAKDDI